MTALLHRTIPAAARLASVALAGFALLACGGSGATVAPPASDSVAVTVSPASASTGVSGIVPFAAAVTGTTNLAVTWKVTPAGGGTIDSSGRYTAPATVGTYSVEATSVADPTKTGAAVVVVNDSVVDTSIIPADRRTLWNPGLNAVGGIPVRTVIYKTLNPSGGDDTGAIQAALDACPANQVVKLGPGTFRITGEGLAIGRSNVTLRGSGSTATMLVKPRNSSFPVIIIGTRWVGTKQPVNLTADAIKGTSTASVASNPGYKVGELLIVNQLTDTALSWWGPNCAGASNGCRGWFAEQNRPIGQVMQVESVSGNTITFNTPFHIDFKTSSSAHVVRYDHATQVEYSGIEDLYVSNGEGGDGGGNIHFFATAYSWVKNVESDKSLGTSVNFDGTFRCELRDSYLHSTLNPSPGGDGYGIGVNVYAADNLIENNISWNFNKVIVMRASGGGNVIGYNYMQDGWGDGYPTIPEIGINGAHYTTPHMELFEGNEAWDFESETYWGNSIYLTVFRNSLTGLRVSAAPLVLTDQNDRHAAGLSNNCWWFTFMGNVLGYAGMPLNAPMPGGNTGQTVWKVQKAPSDGDNVAAMWSFNDSDATTIASTIRHGNYDHVSKATAWDPTIANRTLPPSLYLASKPAFFGTNPWPWVDPITGSVGTLPAKVRFNALH